MRPGFKTNPTSKKRMQAILLVFAIEVGSLGSIPFAQALLSPVAWFACFFDSGAKISRATRNGQALTNRTKRGDIDSLKSEEQLAPGHVAGEVSKHNRKHRSP